MRVTVCVGDLDLEGDTVEDNVTPATPTRGVQDKDARIARSLSAAICPNHQPGSLSPLFQAHARTGRKVYQPLENGSETY